MTFGVVKSQMSFFTSIDLHTKMSFNSNNAVFWETNKVNLSNEFIYENKNITLRDPLRLGISLGASFKSGNELMMSLQYDGVSSISRIIFPSADFSTDPNDVVSLSVLTRSRTQQSKLSVYYYYNFLRKKNKTTFAISPIFGFVWRGGPLGAEPVGSFGGEALLPNNTILQYNNTSYTAFYNRAFVYGLAVKSDLYRKEKYLFSMGLQFTPSKRYVSYVKTTVKVINTNNQTNYIFYQYNTASALYFTLSRKFQIYPRKKRKVKDK